MTARGILHMALLLCFATMAFSRSYNLLHFQQRSSNLACQKLLQQLNGTLEACLEDRANFEIPAEVKQPQHFEKEDATLVIYEMVQQIFRILKRKVSKTGWNETIVENLLSELYKQMDHLETILEEELEEENATRGTMRTILHLKRYYLRILRYLRAKDFSSCAWTIVRVELLRNFSFLGRLTDYLHK
ncbi:interferon beta [Tenrec ecaudatus]|uniref:interferon beta n=1 Tax=Tenrec ecaudatus TaxID=94439 RepID=UPI003F5A28FD